MFNEIPESLYLLYKGIDSLIFTSDYEYTFEVFKKLFTINDSILKILCIRVDSLKNSMDESMKVNIFNIIKYFRYEYECNEENREEIVSLCNKVISSVNSCNNTLIKQFVIEQLYYRGFCISSILNAVRKNTLNDAFLDVKYFIANDFNILCLHTVCSEEEYKLGASEIVNVNLPCMYSLNMILVEYPNILENKIFKDRINNTNTLLKKSIEKDGEKSSIPYKVLLKEYNIYKKRLFDMNY